MSDYDYVPPTREDGPAWSSPTDGSDRGWPDGRYIVAFEIDGVTEEDCRKQTLPEARARRYLLHGELARMGHTDFKVVVWDAEKRRDLAEAEAEDGTVGPRKAARSPTLTDEQRDEVRRRHAEGETVTELAKAFGVSYGVVNYAVAKSRQATKKETTDAEGS